MFPCFLISVTVGIFSLIPSPQYIHAAPRVPSVVLQEMVDLGAVFELVSGFDMVGLFGSVFGVVGVLLAVVGNITGVFGLFFPGLRFLA